MADDVIFEPLKFRSLEVKNRIFRSNISGRFDNSDGSGTQTRINWETKFAKGGVGAIVSSFVPVTLHGRIADNYATIHTDDHIPFWAAVGKAVHRHDDCKFIMQLSHSGRQQDLPGIVNRHKKAISSTAKPETLHGFLCEAMTKDEIEKTVEDFAEGARRAQEAGLDGVELHAANGYLITQFLSSGINDRTDDYGGPLEHRARFLLEIIRAIRRRCGEGFHLQVKISAVERNNVIPWEGRGNTLEDSIQVCKWVEQAGADCIHVSTGSMFPHPLNPPGTFPFEEAVRNYDAMITTGISTFRNYLLFRYRILRPLFRLIWNRMSRGIPVEGISLDDAAAIKSEVRIPVISTGGYQTASVIRAAIEDGKCDAVSMARTLVANNDLPNLFKAGRDRAEEPCTYCNKCLFNDIKHPLGCYELSRFDGDHEKMIEEIMTVYHPQPTFN